MLVVEADPDPVDGVVRSVNIGRAFRRRLLLSSEMTLMTLAGDRLLRLFLLLLPPLVLLRLPALLLAFSLSVSTMAGGGSAAFGSGKTEAINSEPEDRL